jgi:leucyl-tRNA synthetase
MGDWLAEKGIGEKTASYHLRDWIFSRQHYWGEPIPMIKCPKCGWVPVPDKDLPIVLPEVRLMSRLMMVKVRCLKLIVL